MITDELNDLLSLLAATIFADKRVFAEEIETFIGVANRLQKSCKIDPPLSEGDLLDWFEANKNQIKANITAPEFETWLKNCLVRLDHISDKPVVLKIMTDIAKSDNEFHISEKALIVLTSRYWGLELA